MVGIYSLVRGKKKRAIKKKGHFFKRDERQTDKHIEKLFCQLRIKIKAILTNGNKSLLAVGRKLTGNRIIGILERMKWAIICETFLWVFFSLAQ